MSSNNRDRPARLLWNSSRIAPIITDINVDRLGTKYFNLTKIYNNISETHNEKFRNQEMKEITLEMRNQQIEEVKRLRYPISRMRIEGYIREFVFTNILLSHLKGKPRPLGDHNRQHFTPNVYSKNFSDVYGEEYGQFRLGFFNIADHGITGSSKLIGAIPHTSQEKYLYAPGLEQLLSVYEGEYGNICKKIMPTTQVRSDLLSSDVTDWNYLQNNSYNIWDRIVLSTFIAIQALRTPTKIDIISKNKNLPPELELTKNSALVNSIITVATELSLGDWNWIHPQKALFFLEEPVINSTPPYDSNDKIWRIPIGRNILLQISPPRKLRNTVTPSKIHTQTEQEYIAHTIESYMIMVENNFTAFGHPNEVIFDPLLAEIFIEKLPKNPTKREQLNRAPAQWVTVYPGEKTEAHNIRWKTNIEMKDAYNLFLGEM